MKWGQPGNMWLVHKALEVSLTAEQASSATDRRRRTRSARSLGSQLERDRLEKRARRVRQVIDALRERASAREGGAPRPLRAAIEDFGRELADLERQLRRAG
jgi:uncharacterized membrane protein YccC